MNAPDESDLLAADVASDAKHRFSILDFMLAMMAFAVALGLRQNLTQVPGTINPQDPFWGALFFWYTVGFNTVTLFGIILLVRGRWGSAERRVWQPGHIMLIIPFAQIVLLIVAAVLVQLSEIKAEDLGPITEDVFWHAAFIIIHAGAYLVSFVFSAIGIYAFRSSRWWTACFSMLTTLFLLSLIGQLVVVAPTILDIPMSSQSHQWMVFVGNIGTGVMMLSCLCVVISVIIDLTRKTPRDVAHWMGLVSLFGQMLVGRLLLMLAMQFVDPVRLFGR